MAYEYYHDQHVDFEPECWDCRCQKAEEAETPCLICDEGIMRIWMEPDMAPHDWEIEIWGCGDCGQTNSRHWSEPVYTRSWRSWMSSNP